MSDPTGHDGLPAACGNKSYEADPLQHARCTPAGEQVQRREQLDALSQDVATIGFLPATLLSGGEPAFVADDTAAASENVLIVGESNTFEYAQNLAAANPGWTVTGSRLGNALAGSAQEELPGVEGLPNLRLLDNVDATRLQEGEITGQETYSRIVFNNPHIETGNAAERAQATADLIEGFVASARTQLTPGGFARVNINPQFVSNFPVIETAILRAGGELVGRFADDPFGLYAPFTPLRTSGLPLRTPDNETLGEGLSSYNFP